MAGITTSPQLRESPETANFQTGVGAFCAARLRESATGRSSFIARWFGITKTSKEGAAIRLVLASTPP
jgi:hypothetical protein